MSKKALIVTRVSGFVPQFEMNNVKILQEMGYEVHYAANYEVVVYGNDNHRLANTGIKQHHIAFGRSPFSRDVWRHYKQLKKLMLEEEFDLIHCHMPMTGVLTRMVAKKVRKLTGKKMYGKRQGGMCRLCIPRMDFIFIRGHRRKTGFTILWKSIMQNIPTVSF